ncbi:MAG: hypothetical protein JSU70_02385 [Phycisphaerales bacterium]|nr:MAG: hypothetical protein JSU70_02385 [Phycisphaerales bacterium]
MKKALIATTILTSGLLPVMVNAAIVSVSGPPSNAGILPAIIPAPANALNSTASNFGMEGFDEAQGVVTTVAHIIDGGGTIPAGTTVNSHMIFLNQPDGTGGTLSHRDVVWTFDGPIIGVMSDGGGNREANSTFELGAPGTNYTVGPSGQVAPYGARGMEGGDSYTVAGNQITVNMIVSQPGDWIRVVTAIPTIAVDIDIKPGSYPNSINPEARGVIPVAILTTADFDASSVNPATVALEDVLAKEKGKSGKYGSLEDVDGDGDLDLVVQIPNTIDWPDDATEATLTGETWDGIAIEGTDSVRIVPPE